MSDMMMSAAEANALFSPEFFDSVEEGSTINEDKITSAMEKRASEAKAKAQAKKEENWDFTDDAEDADDNFSFYDIDEDAEDFGDEDSGDKTEETPDENFEDDDVDFTDPVAFFNTLPEDVEFAPGITKKALRDMMRSREEYAEKEQFINHQYQKFDEGNNYIADILGRNFTETQKTIDAIERALNNQSIDNVRRGQLYQELQVQKSKQAQIERDYSEVQSVRKVQEQHAIDQRFYNTDLAMKKHLGNEWDRNATLQYALNSGVDLEDIKKSISPALASLFVKAMKFDEGERKRGEKLTNAITRAPRSTSSQKREVSRDDDTSTSLRKKAAIKKAKETGSVSDLFEFLED